MVFAVVAALLLAVAVTVNGLLFFGMAFAGDSCGTSAGTQRFCDDSGVWMLVAMFGPSVALAAAAATAVLGAVWVRRPWTALVLGVPVYAAGPALALFSVFGWTTGPLMPGCRAPCFTPRSEMCELKPRKRAFRLALASLRGPKVTINRLPPRCANTRGLDTRS
ncbi:hypothetical protein [Streptomyces sp. NPDC059224]|uniref:hypothetical protein n=1 Tax=Streptomyces sp. NPDC059224 TaxID=3346775 RepID=UPI0036BADAB2